MACRYKISTSYHMFGTANWNILSQCIFENIEIARLKQGQLQNSEGDLQIARVIYPKNRSNQACCY